MPKTDLPAQVRHPHRRRCGVSQTLQRMVLATVLALASAGAGAASSPRLAIHDGPAGATCQFYDQAAGVAWKHRQGDWRDADGVEQGTKPFAAVTSPRAAGAKASFELTSLVQQWSEGTLPNAGVLIRGLDGSRGIARFGSGQAAQAEARPRLSVRFADGSTTELAPSGDTTLVCSTVRALGTLGTLRAGDDMRALLRFELPNPPRQRVVEATLVLTTTGQQFGAPELGVFRVESPLVQVDPAAGGLANAYPGDVGLAKDPDVFLFEDFETEGWQRHWSYVRQSNTFDTVASDPERHMQPLRGKALRVRVEKDSHLGINAGYRFRGKTGSEPEEVYFRYYLRFGDDWRQTRDGGKMPGIAATYNRAGWGGRKADGTNGWSIRGGFAKAVPEGHMLEGGTLLGSYAYLPDRKGAWGAFWPWSAAFPGVLFNNRWYCIEQHVRVNTPGQHDGVLRVWIDGKPALTRTGLRMRDIDSIRIEEVWLNVYHGGTAVSPRDQHLFIDNLVIARRYIGPMATGAAPVAPTSR